MSHGLHYYNNKIKYWFSQLLVQVYTFTNLVSKEFFLKRKISVESNLTHIS
jgi:hypothetical protein